MSNSRRYERVSTRDEDDHVENAPQVPSSPPPPFQSRPSSPRERLFDPLENDNEAERTLAETFDDGSDDEGEQGDQSARRLVAESTNDTGSPVERRVTQYPSFQPTTTRVYGTGRTNDGVFSNLMAKPTSGGDDLDEKPPSYEQAAADATPPYWETTVLAPGMLSDEVYVDGLPVGSVFSFVWNAMISMSFQIVGFLLTYLLHTTHAAKNGSRAGLGITLVQYGFSMKGAASLIRAPDGTGNPTAAEVFAGAPPDPNSHDFDPNAEAAAFDQGVAGGAAAAGISGISATDWFAYILMIVGWFILIRSVSDFLRARRHEQLVLQSPDRGLGVAVVAEGESPEGAV